MAVIPGKKVYHEDGTVTITWTAMGATDTGGAVVLGDLWNVVLHNVGTGTGQLRGSNDNSNFVNSGSALVANTLNAITVIPKYVDFVNAANTATVIIKGNSVRA